MAQARSSEDQTPNSTRRRVGIAILVGLVLLAGLVVLLIGPDKGPVPPDGSETPTATGTSGPQSTTAQNGNLIEISSCTDLRRIDEDLAGHYVLRRDLECSESHTWNDGQGLLPIGGNGGQDVFSGTFDGRGHTIANLYIENHSANYVGLFGEIGVDDTMDPDYPRAGTVTHLHLENVTVVGGRLRSTGGVVGALNRGKVVDTTVTGTVSGGGNTGGIAGTMNTNATIRKSASRAVMTNSGVGPLGGVVGFNDGGSIEQCAATGTLRGSNHVRVGGLVGENDDGGRIAHSYSQAAVRSEGTDSVAGGLVALNRETTTIRNSYAAGPVTGDGVGAIGGLVALNQGDCDASFWDTNATRQSNSACGTGLGTNVTQTREVYVDAGWDFEDIWYMEDYPRLRWRENESK